MQWAKNKQGFTIVELLIVVIVIAILATITIVGFNGIQNRAKDSALKSEISTMRKQLSVFATTNSDTYPSSINSCPTPVTGAACIAAETNNTVTYYGAGNTYCLSATNPSGSSYYTNESGAVSTGTCAPRSCYHIQQANSSASSGIHQVYPGGSSTSIPVYCDMTTAGGGWTLIVSNPGPSSSWNGTNVYSENTASPSISSRYSILNQANGIKTNINGNVNYMIDAVSRGRWGGVWSAPYSVNLQSTAPQDVATLTTKFDTWTQDTNATDANGTQTPSNVVPWVSSVAGSQGLTTWGNTGNWYGTLVTYGSTWSPAPYIASGQQNPGVIWYWVR